MDTIGLHDADATYLRNKSFPNYALMKLSAYHKAKGNRVKWWNPLEHVDALCSSKIFDFTPESLYLPAWTTTGGTGYSIKEKLPQDIDDMYPDYSIYPNCHYSIGFTTRGCPNHCRWCVVPEKEGGIAPYREWRDLVRPDSKELVLMDNNILAHEHGIRQLEGLIGTGYHLDLNQGMDARLVTPEITEILSRLDWIRYIRFSCDQKSQIDHINRVCGLLERYEVKPYRVFVYMLVTADIADAAYRAEALRRWPGIRLFAQAEQNARLGIHPNAVQREFAQRYIYSGVYRKETWEQYAKRHGIEWRGNKNDMATISQSRPKGTRNCG